MKAPLTVIVTAHNNADTVSRCLDALIGQTFSNINILCIDDASTDGTLKVLQAYAKEHKNISVIHSTKNQGIARVRNQAIDACTTPFLMFCDGDDYYTPDACQLLHDAITSSKSDLAIGEIKVTYQAHQEMKPSDDNYYSLKYHGFQPINSVLTFALDFSPTNKIYRKSILDKYNIRCPAGKHFEDAYLNIAYLAVSKSIYFVNQPVYNYIRHTGSIMSNTWSKNSGTDYSIEHLDIAFELYDFFAKHQLFKKPQNTEIFWHAFRDFESLAINHSKSRSNTKRAQTRIRAFIKEHQASFNSIPPALQAEIRYYSHGTFHLYLTRLKHLFLKLTPNYHLAASNTNRMTMLKNNSQQLLEKIDQLYNQE